MPSKTDKSSNPTDEESAKQKGGKAMRNLLKATTLENRFPLLAIEKSSLERRRNYGRLSGGLTRTLHRRLHRIRDDALGLAQGYQGVV